MSTQQRRGIASDEKIKECAPSAPRIYPFITCAKNMGEPPRREPLIPAGDGLKWEPIWEMTDEFWRTENGRPKLYHIWEPFNRNWSGRAPGFFAPENVVVTHTSMQLWSREENVWARKNGAYLHSKGYRDFSTSFVRSKHRQRYGYFEIYCKLMDSDISSAFWFAHNEPRGSPDSWWTEIDVFEYSTSSQRGTDQRQRINTNVHVHRNGKHPDWGHMNDPKHFDMGFDLSKEPHKWALDWTDQNITWYFDDKPIRSIPNYYFKRPLHLQFDSETFPRWFGLPQTGGSHRNNLPNKFEIYYVRSWKR